MKLSRYEKLKQKLEILKLEKNFLPLNSTLYWFSFLGNIFLIYFGYFFIRSITDTLPDLFPYQHLFFAVFIALFLTGYELTKRFVIDQTSVSITTSKKISSGIIIGVVASLLLIAGSFYMSINGAHRLVDNTDKIEAVVDSTTQKNIDDITAYYDKEINFYRAQPAKNRQDRRYRDSIVTTLQAQKDQKLQIAESKIKNKTESKVDRNKENDTAFVFMTFFLEFVVILGVAFNAFYTISTYHETGKLLETPKYKQYVQNLKLLKLYYNNGKKSVGDIAMSYSRLVSLAKSQKMQMTLSEIRSFVNLCAEMEIVEDTKNRRKQYKMSYQDAQAVMKKDELV